MIRFALFDPLTQRVIKSVEAKNPRHATLRLSRNDQVYLRAHPALRWIPLQDFRAIARMNRQHHT